MTSLWADEYCDKTFVVSFGLASAVDRRVVVTAFSFLLVSFYFVSIFKKSLQCSWNSYQIWNSAHLCLTVVLVIWTSTLYLTYMHSNTKLIL